MNPNVRARSRPEDANNRVVRRRTAKNTTKASVAANLDLFSRWLAQQTGEERVVQVKLKASLEYAIPFDRQLPMIAGLIQPLCPRSRAPALQPFQPGISIHRIRGEQLTDPLDPLSHRS